jgi:hypothetical protein
VRCYLKRKWISNVCMAMWCTVYFSVPKDQLFHLQLNLRKFSVIPCTVYFSVKPTKIVRRFAGRDLKAPAWNWLVFTWFSPLKLELQTNEKFENLTLDTTTCLHLTHNSWPLQNLTPGVWISLKRGTRLMFYHILYIWHRSTMWRDKNASDHLCYPGSQGAE